MADYWSGLQQSLPAQAARGLWDSLMGNQSQSSAPSSAPAVRPINPALLDSGLYPRDPADNGPRFDRYREDEPGIQQWVRQYGSRLDQGSGTAPAIPPDLLQGGSNADRRGEIPDPQWLKEYFRARNLDIGKI